MAADAQRGTARFRSTSGSIQLGFDTQVGGAGRLGLAFGYQRLSLSDAIDGRGTTDALRANVYGSYSLGPIGLSGVLGYAHGYDTTERQVGVGVARGRRGTNQWLAAGKISAPLSLGAITVTPDVGGIASRVIGGAFTESGAVSDAFLLRGEISDRTFVSPFAGIGFSTVIATDAGGQWIPDLSLGYRRSDIAQGSDYILTAADGTRFAGNRVNLDRDNFTVGAGLTAHQGRWTGAFRYRGQFASGRRDNQVSFVVRRAF